MLALVLMVSLTFVLFKECLHAAIQSMILSLTLLMVISSYGCKQLLGCVLDN